MAFGQTLGLPFILDSRVKGRITLESAQPIALDRAYAMFVSALSLQGFAVVEQDGYAKILPAADAKSAGVGRADSTRIQSGGLMTRVFRLEHESATQVMSAIRALVPASNPITANPATNTLVVTDTVENLRQVAKLIASLDSPQEGFIRSYASQHALASDLAPMVDRLVNNVSSKGGSEYAHQRVTLLPSSRNNSLVAQGFDESRVRFALEVARQLDTPTKNPGNVHVVYLRNAEAVPLANTLQGLFRSGQQQSSVGGAASDGGKPPPASLARPDNNPATSALSSATGELKTPEGVIVRAEPGLNALIVVAPDAIYKQIRSVIDRLDVRRAQVYIESLIVEVSTDRAAEFGVQFQYIDGLNAAGNNAFGGTNFGNRSAGASGNLLDLTRNPTNMAGGLNLGLVRGTIDFNGTQLTNLGVLARALETEGAGNVIATPNLMTLDNEEARITIGQNVPFITGSYSTTAGAGTATPFQTVERKDVGTTLRVKPTVSEGGAIKMQIFQEVSSVTDRTLAAGLITNRRVIESQVVVDDEQMIVLGGLIEDREVTEKSKVPLLGDIPLLGGLFSYDTTRRVKSNLLVFLRPVIIRDQSESNVLSVGRYDNIRNDQTELPRPGVLRDFGRRMLDEKAMPTVKPKGPAQQVRPPSD